MDKIDHKTICDKFINFHKPRCEICHKPVKYFTIKYEPNYGIHLDPNGHFKFEAKCCGYEMVRLTYQEAINTTFIKFNTDSEVNITLTYE